MAPIAAWSGWPGGTSPVRKVRTSSAGSEAIRRPSTVIESSVASSAQCTSSSTSTVGCGANSSSAISSVWTTCGAAPAESASSSSGETLPTRSRIGPSGRGIERSSQVPSSARPPSCMLSRKRETSAVLPIPGSPVTKTTRPSPSAAWSRASASVARAASRSSSSTRLPSPRLGPGPARRARLRLRRRRRHRHRASRRRILHRAQRVGEIPGGLRHFERGAADDRLVRLPRLAAPRNDLEERPDLVGPAAERRAVLQEPATDGLVEVLVLLDVGLAHGVVAAEPRRLVDCLLLVGARARQDREQPVQLAENPSLHGRLLGPRHRVEEHHSAQRRGGGRMVSPRASCTLLVLGGEHAADGVAPTAVRRDDHLHLGRYRREPANALELLEHLRHVRVREEGVVRLHEVLLRC